MTSSNVTKRPTAKEVAGLLRNIDIEAVKKIFSPQHIGAIYLPDIVAPPLLFELQKDVAHLQKTGRFTIARRRESDGTEQNFSYFYIEAGKNPFSELDNLNGMRKLAAVHIDTIYNPIAEWSGNFKPVEMPNSIAVNQYPAREGFIGYHRDYPYNRNMIMAISVDGISQFSVALNKKGDGKLCYILTPGSGVLMRAPFDSVAGEGEEALRPLHTVKTLEGKRKAILLRNINEEMMFAQDKKSTGAN